VRALARARRQRKAAEERQRFIDQIVGAGYREAQAKAAKAGRQRQRGAVAAVVKLFAKERRRDLGAAAIAAMLGPDRYPVELVPELLAELQARGDYDRIVAETGVAEAWPSD
jgi:phosphoglycolate phosphatase-like HAD superfamily hydrolase